MVFALIGSIVGLLMGITGAGGSVVAIPLFQVFLDSSLNEATSLSLITVVLGTGVNLIRLLEEVKWKISLSFVVFGFLGNYLAVPLKLMVPVEAIVSLLVMIGAFSIWSVLRVSVTEGSSNERRVHPVLVSITGILLGIVTTLTGLGGGVLLLPILLRVFQMSYEEALPTSLSTIFLISLSSLMLQGKKTLELYDSGDMLLLTFGVLVSFAALQFLLSFPDGRTKLKLRKFVFVLATISSLVTIVIKTV